MNNKEATENDYNLKVRELNKRRVILSIPYIEIFNYIYPLKDSSKITVGDHQAHVVNILQRKELPTGYMIKGAHQNYERDTIDFIIIHPSFDIVPEGGIAPQWDEPILEMNTYEVKIIETTRSITS